MEAIRQGDIPGVQLRCRRQLPVTPEEAWRWLTEPDRLELWLGSRVTLEGAGGEILLIDNTMETDQPAIERLETLDSVPLRRLRFSLELLDAGWKTTTRLELELKDCRPGSELSVLHVGFQHLPLSSCLTIWETYRRRWRAALDRLESAIGSASSDR